MRILTRNYNEIRRTTVEIGPQREFMGHSVFVTQIYYVSNNVSLLREKKVVREREKNRE